MGDLLYAEVPVLRAGELEVVAIARRPGVLSKVAVRPRDDLPTPIAVGIGADHVARAASIGADDIARVREQLDGERIDVITWQSSAPAFIADALGLAEVPPILLLPGIRHARVLVGEIDLRGIAGWRGMNAVLASALTGWRIRLEPVAATAAWQRLEAAMAARRPIAATVVGHTDRGGPIAATRAGQTDRGVRVEVLGLYALLQSPGSEPKPPGQERQVRVTRMDPDEGRIFVSDVPPTTDQLPLV